MDHRQFPESCRVIGYGGRDWQIVGPDLDGSGESRLGRGGGEFIVQEERSRPGLLRPAWLLRQAPEGEVARWSRSLADGLLPPA
jgi:hypothetical protein